MREQLQNLLTLQNCDVKVRELEAAAKKLPEKLDPLRRDLAKLQGMLDGERGKLAETESWRKAQQDLVDRERDALKSAQTKLQASKNSKEFGAASREVENKRKAIGDREGELKKVIEASSTSTTQLTQRDTDVQKLRDELAESEAAMADQVADLAHQLESARAAREVARGSVEAQWLKIYDSLVGKRGYAVAPVVKGTCQGCHVALPPQLNNTLARMQSIEMCPRCGRLVYRKELLEPEVARVVDEAAFWALVESTRKRRTKDHMKAFATALAGATLENVADVHAVVWGYYLALDRKELWAAADAIRGGCSDDSWDYFRQWLVLQGRERVLEAVRNPDAMAAWPLAEDPGADGLISIASGVYRERTGKQPPELGFTVDTSAWPPDRVADTSWTAESKAQLVPKLVARFAKA